MLRTFSSAISFLNPKNRRCVFYASIKWFIFVSISVRFPGNTTPSLSPELLYPKYTYTHIMYMYDSNVYT